MRWVKVVIDGKSPPFFSFFLFSSLFFFSLLFLPFSLPFFPLLGRWRTHPSICYDWNGKIYTHAHACFDLIWSDMINRVFTFTLLYFILLLLWTDHHDCSFPPSCPNLSPAFSPSLFCPRFPNFVPVFPFPFPSLFSHPLTCQGSRTQQFSIPITREISTVQLIVSLTIMRNLLYCLKKYSTLSRTLLSLSLSLFFFHE